LMWRQVSVAVSNNYKTPEQVDKRLTPRHKEYKSPKDKETMAKPHGIERKGSKYKVFLDISGVRVHIGYTKTLEQAEEMLKQAKEDAHEF